MSRIMRRGCDPIVHGGRVHLDAFVPVTRKQKVSDFSVHLFGDANTYNILSMDIFLGERLLYLF
jgi:hypothetical protein